MKSYVSVEQSQCVVCLTCFDTGTILLNRRLSATLDRHTVTGPGICPTCEDHLKTHVALIEADEDPVGDVASISKTPRTGRYVFMREEAFSNVFGGVPLPDKRIAFIEKSAMEKLVAMVEPTKH